MNRLQKKCLVASTGCHLLLALILFVGPAFLSSGDRPEDLPVLDFVPAKTVDALVSGGGNPKAAPPPVVQSPPEVAPPKPAPAARVKETAPPKPAPVETVKETASSKADPESLEVSSPPKHRVEISTKVVKSRGSSTGAKAATEARRQAAAAIGQAVAGIRGELSPGTTIELKGPGGGGLPYANWMQAVKSVYDRAWLLPDSVTSDSATAMATVTIARDGRVISSSMVRLSGNADVDQSVQATLNRVRYAAPLPDDAREDQRSVTIYFDVKAKLHG